MEMDRRVILLPKEIESFDNLKFIKLAHPATSDPTIFGLSSKDGGLFQISIWENELNSWAIGNSIVSDGNVYIATPFNVLFLLLPLLEKTQKQGFCKLEDILYEATTDYPEIIQIESILGLNEKLQLICDHQFQMDHHFFRLSEDKLTAWLKKKTDHLISNLESFDACKEHISPSMKELDRAKLGIRLLSDVLSPAAKQLVMKTYNVSDLKGEALVYFNDEIKHRRKEKDDFDEKKTKKAKPAPAKALKTRNTTGMKKLSSFFAKK